MELVGSTWNVADPPSRWVVIGWTCQQTGYRKARKALLELTVFPLSRISILALVRIDYLCENENQCTQN